MGIRGMATAARTAAGPRADSAFLRLGGMGKKGKALHRSAFGTAAKDSSGRMSGVNEEGLAQLRARGKRNAMIGGGTLGALGLMGQARSSGVSGVQPGSTGGYTGY